MPQKVADAANIAPYLTHVVSHHGQLSLIPPDNAGRMRQAKQKKPRSINPDDDIRFNTGPKFYKILPGSSRGGSDGRSHSSHSRSNRGDRRRPARDGRENELVDDEDTIPNYPPPTFDEAMSSPPIACPSSLTLTNSNTRTFHPSSSSAASAPTSAPSASAITDEYSSDADSDSEVSVIASPGSSSHCESFTNDCSGDDSRSPTPSPVLVDEADDNDEFPSAVTPISNKQPGRRKLSLSPLRTLLPFKSSNSPQRALSAHPYSQPRNSSSFFRSTTSLTTFPFGRSASSPTTSGKGKGKDTEEEDFESWVDVRRPTSLLLNVEMAMSTPSPTPTPSSPPVIQKAETAGTPPAKSSAVPLAPLVDKKPSFLKSKAKKEPRGRDRAPSPLGTLLSSHAMSAEAGPVVTTVRTRQTQPSPLAQNNPKPASPLRSETWNGATDNEAVQQAILQRAINTPLPNTPTEKALTNPRTRDQDIPPIPALPAAVLSHSSGPDSNIVPSCISGTDWLQVSRSPTVCHNHESANIHTFPSPTRPAMHPINTQKSSVSCNSPSSPVSAAPSSSSSYTITPSHTPTQLQFGHHYPGRPLPRPPPSSTRTVVDSTYSGSVTEASTSCGSGCPEGLLIDFEEPVEEHDSPVGTDLTSPPSSAPRIGESNGATSISRTQVSSNRPFNPLDARYRIGGIDEYANRNRTVSSARAASVTEPSPTREYSHFTDLDLLVSRLDETELRNGSSYDTLLMLSEFMGSASPPSHTPTRNAINQRAVTSVPPSELKPFLPAPLLGQVSVDRRRVTKDGRVRVKLVLLECAVDKCGICLTQFKEGDCAVMSSTACHHAFHETCLRRWLSGNSKTCPNCRIQIGDIQSC